MQKGFWIIVAVVIAAMVGLFFVVGGKSKSNNTRLYSNPMEIQAQDYKQGKGKRVVIEYGDFQCPACAAAEPAVQQMKEAFKDEVTFVFRHFPLVSLHPQAMAAHRAAEAAGRQGKFWEMHDLLYQSQQSWSNNNSAASAFESYAQQLSLNMDQYRADLASQDVFDRIDADQKSGQSLGITATPTFFVDGKKIDQPPSTIEEWAALLIPEEIKNQQ